MDLEENELRVEPENSDSAHMECPYCGQLDLPVEGGECDACGHLSYF